MIPSMVQIGILIPVLVLVHERIYGHTVKDRNRYLDPAVSHVD